MVLNFVFAVSVIWSFLPSTIMVRAVTREYYIAAVIKEWNYAPSGQDKIKGVPLQNDRYVQRAFHCMYVATSAYKERSSPLMLKLSVYPAPA